MSDPIATLADALEAALARIEELCAENVRVREHLVDLSATYTRACQTIDRLAKHRDDSQAEIARLTAERDAAIKALCEAAKAKGQAEGKLAASEMAGVVEGWKTRAEKAEAERDQYREAATRHRNEVQRLLHDVIEPLKAERDQALAQRPASAAGWIAGRDKAADYMADRANGCPIFETASVYQVHSNSIRTLPLDPDAEAALKRVVDATWNEAVEAAANSANSLAGHDETLRWCVSEIRALARPTEGEQDD